MTEGEEAWSVSNLLSFLKNTVEGAVGTCRVVGEVGSCRQPSSGHIYFTIKDSGAQLSCVLYRFRAGLFTAHLKEGMLVQLTGTPTIWEGRGSLQFIVSHVKEAGVGSLQQQFEALKEKLRAEGLFDQERKRKLPRYPRTVGLVTSATGAVIQDMRHRLEQRAPWIRAYLLPVPVQGEGAELKLADALRRWSEPEKNGLPSVEYIIIARGGGSQEDLNCFNQEILARAIAACSVPVVSAVGHETDFTIADFVADLRAPTPTAAIELTTPDTQALHAMLRETETRLQHTMRRGLEKAHLQLRVLESGALRHPLDLLAPYVQRADMFQEELIDKAKQRLNDALHTLDLYHSRINIPRLLAVTERGQERLTAARQKIAMQLSLVLNRRLSTLDLLEQRLLAVSPHHALQRGFALVYSEKGTLVKRATDATTRLRIQFADDTIDAIPLNDAQKQSTSS